MNDTLQYIIVLDHADLDAKSNSIRVNYALYMYYIMGGLSIMVTFDSVRGPSKDHKSIINIKLYCFLVYKCMAFSLFRRLY